jgi:hypothetical protein
MTVFVHRAHSGHLVRPELANNNRQAIPWPLFLGLTAILLCGTTSMPPESTSPGSRWAGPPTRDALFALHRADLDFATNVAALRVTAISSEFGPDTCGQGACEHPGLGKSTWTFLAQ